MPKRHLVLLLSLVAAFAGFIAFAALDSNWSVGDVLGLCVFAAFFVLLVLLLLRNPRLKSCGRLSRFAPIKFWVVFASFAAAFALSMLLSVLAMPWLGFAGFEYLLGPRSCVGSCPLSGHRVPVCSA